MSGPSAIGAQPPPEDYDEEWLMLQEEEEGDEPFCNCSAGHSIEETDWNQCDSCGKSIYDEEPAVPPAATFADGMTAEDDRRFLEATSGLTHNARIGGQMTQPQQGRFEGFAVTHSNPNDIVMTDKAVARKIVEHFRPRGTVLDPCRGNGAFFDEMPGADWCEVREGRDFFEWNTRVDWIVSNPPFSIFFEWLRHSMSLADDIVYLIPLGKVWQSNRVLRMVHEWGGIREILIVGNGRKELGFPVGFAVGAVHFQRGYRGDMRNGFLPSNAELRGRPLADGPA